VEEHVKKSTKRSGDFREKSSPSSAQKMALTGIRPLNSPLRENNRNELENVFANRRHMKKIKKRPRGLRAGNR
jgi:hypothetical protein